MTCLVEKGSSVHRALAERSILNLSGFDGGAGDAPLRLEGQAIGWSGGETGAHRADKAFVAAAQRLGWELQDARGSSSTTTQPATASPMLGRG